jgi:hypothetical protein
VIPSTHIEYTSPYITAHYWSKESLESALHDAGPTEVRWMVPTPSPEGIEKHVTVTCRKS